MARLNDLDTLIPQYAVNKSELDDYKKICDKENAQIKAIMKDFVVTNYEAGGYKANYIISRRESMNEAKLLDIAHRYNLDSIIKTREYIDFDALEDIIYKGGVDAEALLEMDKAKEVKEVISLKITKVKEEK